MTLLRVFPMVVMLLVVPFLHAEGKDDPKKKKGPPELEGLKALKHADPKVRYRAAQTLADLGPLAKFALPELTEALKDKHPMVQIKVAEALWKIDQTPSATLLPVLLTALKHPEPTVRAAAPRVIAMIGGKSKKALDALEQAVADKDFDVKLAAITALGDLGPAAKDRAGVLLDVTDSPDFALLEPFVGAALANLGDGTIPTLTKALGADSSDRRRLAAYALGSMGPKAAPATEELAKAVRHKDPALRTAAARALGKIGAGAKSSLPQLEKTLNDEIPAVRIEAALATWFITAKATHIGVLVKALSDDSVRVRESACQAVAVMKAGARDAVDPVARLLEDKELRLRAIMTLGEIGPPASKTLPTFKKLLQDKDRDVQLASAFAAWQISGDAKESMKVLEDLLGTETHYAPTIRTLGEMGPAAAGLLPTLVALYRDEDVAADRAALATAIKKIDPKAAMRLGIK